MGLKCSVLKNRVLKYIVLKDLPSSYVSSPSSSPKVCSQMSHLQKSIPKSPFTNLTSPNGTSQKSVLKQSGAKKST